MPKNDERKNSSFCREETGYIPLAKKGKKEIKKEIFLQKFPFALNIPLFGGNLCVEEKNSSKKFLQKFPFP